MRVDHHAYRKATRVAGFGFLVQAALGVALLVFGILSPDTVFRFAAYFVFGGLFGWLSLIVVFHQHTQERLEALESDELAAGRGPEGSVFSAGAATEGEGPAARRLRLMHHWLMPAVSIVIAAYLGLGAAYMLRHLGALDDPGTGGTEFLVTPLRGWAVAMCLAFAALSFIFSRFVAGMARQTAWQNLRGGAGYMVGNSLVMLAAAGGLVFRFFRPDDQQAMLVIAYAIAVFMLMLVVEIGIHFVLNLYRPRTPGHVPRPAFDSRILSLLAAPESIVRSLNEAVNYQFGFDITSSWGYQLLLRSFAPLLVFGALVVVAMNMVVVVEPHQQAVKTRAGAMVGAVHGSGLMLKLPWPLEAVDVYDVGRVRELYLTAHRVEHPDVQVWSEKIRTDTDLDPFIVSGGSQPEAFSLVDAEISIEYRIKADGLMNYLEFSSDEIRRRERLSVRQGALEAVALREVTDYLSGIGFNDVIATRRGALIADLRRRIQAAFDRLSAGVEVLAVNVLTLQPADKAATYWEDYTRAIEQSRETVAKAESEVAETLAVWVGDPDAAVEILAAIEEWERLRDEVGPDSEAAVAQRIAVERMLAESGATFAQEIADAEADRWIKLMQARAEVSRHQGQLAAFDAAPQVFKERELMNVYREKAAGRRKFLLVGIEPEQVDLEFEILEASPMFSISDAVRPEEESKP